MKGNEKCLADLDESVLHYAFDAWMQRTNPLCRLPVMPMMRWSTAAAEAAEE